MILKSQLPFLGEISKLMSGHGIPVLFQNHFSMNRQLSRGAHLPLWRQITAVHFLLRKKKSPSDNLLHLLALWDSRPGPSGPIGKSWPDANSCIFVRHTCFSLSMNSAATMQFFRLGAKIPPTSKCSHKNFDFSPAIKPEYISFFS